MNEAPQEKKTSYALYSSWDDHLATKTYHLAKLVTIDGKLYLPETDCDWAWGDEEWAKKIAEHYKLAVYGTTIDSAEYTPVKPLETASDGSKDRKEGE